MFALLPPQAGPSLCRSVDEVKAPWAFGRVLGLTLVGLVVVFGPVRAWAKVIKGEVTRVGDTAHLEFKGLAQWTYELKRVSPKKFTLMIPSFDDATVAQLSSFTDNLISDVKVRRDGPDGNYEVTFVVADETVESFDYLTDDPSRLIIDFYRQNKTAEQEPVSSPAAAPAAPAAPQTIEALPAKAGKVTKKLPKKSSGKTASATTDSEGYKKLGAGRKPAGDERLEVGASAAQNAEHRDDSTAKGGAYDAADPEFKRLQIRDYEISEEAIIASRKNVYVRFPMLKMPTSQTPQMLANLPEFLINPKDNQENKEARLLLNLYTKQVEGNRDRVKDRIGAFLKVYDHFMQTYPQTEYDEIVRSLAAHIYYLRWLQSKNASDYENSKTLYKYLIAKYPQSPLTERNRLWLAYAELDRGNGVGVIQEMQDYLANYPKSEQINLVKRAMAEAYILIDKFPDARRIYAELEQSGTSNESRIEAGYRAGDVYFSERDYAGAVKAYQRALEKYPQMAKTYANAYYNMAEALFWQRKYKESLDSHIKFLATYPDHDFAGYAMTRSGELLEAMGADRSRVMGAFLESYFRYPQNPGAGVARVRMLSQQMKGMKDKELAKAMAEIREIGEKSPLPTMDEFSVVMSADGRQRRGDYNEALDQLVTYYQAHPTSGNLELFRTRILRNIAEIIRGKSEKGEFMDALASFNKYSSTWLKRTDRLDIAYYVGRSYEEAGVVDEARGIYEKALAQRIKMKGSAQEKERKVNEQLPSVERLQLRIAAVAKENRDYPGAFRLLQSVKDISQLSPEENVERVLLLAQVYRERGQLDQAKSSLKEFLAAWKGEPEMLIANMLELGDLQMKTGQPLEAEKMADQVLAMKKQGAKMNDDLHAHGLELKGDALLAQNKDMAAVESYQQLLEQYENSRPLSSVRYRVGEVLFRHGDLKGAENVWMALDETKNATLRRLARERLDNSKWQAEHKKYIKRIPAMSEFKEE